MVAAVVVTLEWLKMLDFDWLEMPDSDWLTAELNVRLCDVQSEKRRQMMVSQERLASCGAGRAPGSVWVWESEVSSRAVTVTKSRE